VKSRGSKVRDYNNLVKLAEHAAERGAAFLRAAERPAWRDWTEKSAHDFVTEIDRGCEALLAEELTRAVPGSSIVGEELTPTLVSGGLVWIVDPLDGTSNFLHGFPQYAVSIGCAVDGVLCAGVIHDVTRDVSYRAWAGGGAWAGNTRLSVSAVTEPKRALIGTGFPFRDLQQLDIYLRQFGAITRRVSAIRRPGSAALDLAHVAAGHFDGFWEGGLSPWDIAAGVVLIREAGGCVTRFDGSEDVLPYGDVVGGNPAMHEWLLNILRTA
jgi:myo-inositol-1(or 4)-monophosphatase